jgi:hypothetical protein
MSYWAFHTCIVEYGIDPAIFLDCLSNQSLNLIGFRYVYPNEKCFSATFSYQSHRFVSTIHVITPSVANLTAVALPIPEQPSAITTILPENFILKPLSSTVIANQTAILGSIAFRVA